MHYLWFLLLVILGVFVVPLQRGYHMVPDGVGFGMFFGAVVIFAAIHHHYLDRGWPWRVRDERQD